MSDAAIYQHILVPLDGTPEAEAVLPHVIALASRLGSRVTLVEVVTPPEVVLSQAAAGADDNALLGIDPVAVADAERKEAETYLQRSARKLRASGISVSAKHPEGTPAEGIFDVATAIDADLIAMATHARGLLARLFLGSVADDVLRKAPCPVLLVRADKTS